jgi:hypothetical protein
MPTDKENFALKFIPKTPQQVKEEIILEEKKQKRAEQLAFLENSKSLSFLNEDFKRTTDRFFNINPDIKTQQFIKLDEPIEKKELLEQLKVSGPLVIKDGKISIDDEKLSNLITNQTTAIIQTSLERINGANLIPQGGAVGIKTIDGVGNKTSLTKSVSDLIITGDGVTVTSQGKNVEINIPGVSVVAGDPTIDFARESTMLSVLQYINMINETINSLTGVVIPLSYSGGIGGTNGNWIKM